MLAALGRFLWIPVHTHVHLHAHVHPWQMMPPNGLCKLSQCSGLVLSCLKCPVCPETLWSCIWFQLSIWLILDCWFLPTLQPPILSAVFAAVLLICYWLWPAPWLHYTSLPILLLLASAYHPSVPAYFLAYYQRVLHLSAVTNISLPLPAAHMLHWVLTQCPTCYIICISPWNYANNPSWYI